MSYPGKPSEPKEENKSEFNMGSYDFDRINRILIATSEYSFYVNCENFYYFRPFYAGIHEVYILIRPILVESLKSETDKKFTDILTDIDECERLLLQHEMKRDVSNKRISSKNLEKLKNLKIDLNDLWSTIIDLKQQIGLGIVLKNKLSQRKMIQLGAGAPGTNDSF